MSVGRGNEAASADGEPAPAARIRAHEVAENRWASETHSRLAAIVESSNEAIIGATLDGTIFSWNASAERTYGYTAEEMIGTDSSILAPAGREDEAPRILDEIRAGRAVRSFETVRLRKDGTLIDIDLTVSPIHDATGSVVGASVTARDITQQKRGQEKILQALAAEREATRRLRALDEMKNAFLNAVSHELRTPLSSVVGSAMTLERLGLDLTIEDQRDLLKAITANALKLQRILTDLLDLDRLSRGALKPRLAATELGSLIRGMVDGNDLVHGRQVHVQASSMVLPIDVPKVERIVENLLANAVRYSPPGTPVWLSVERVAEGAVITVDDVGPGVPEELRQGIFEPFRQGPGTSSHSPGVGIGLSLVARFAELHGGRAWVEDRPGGGARFRVLLREPSAPHYDEEE